jgi:hypothetical protein
VIVAGQKRMEPAAALGPDRQLIALDAPTKARVELLGEDGKTLLARGEEIDLQPGRAYAIAIQP